MPADLSLSCEEIERLRAEFDRGRDLSYSDQRALLQHALSEPTRLASARQEGRQEGYREGVEAARQVALHWLASLETDRDRATSTLAHAEAAQMNQRVCGIAIVITAISALSPAPAEPSAPVAPDWPTRCAALEADGIAARKRVVALEAENTKLREGLGNLLFAAVANKYSFSEAVAMRAAGWTWPDSITVVDERHEVARALLRGGPDAG